MKSEREKEMNEENILVMFPAAKNFPIKESLSDPLNDLLNEYVHISDNDLPDYLNENFEDESDFEETYDSLEAFMNRNKKEENLTADDKLVIAVNERLDEINRLKSKIKFYLEEIEMFMPNKATKR